MVRRSCTWLAILLLVGCTARSAGLPTLNTGGAAAIDRMFQAAIDKGEIPGVVAAVTNKNRIVYLKAFGKQDVARGVSDVHGHGVPHRLDDFMGRREFLAGSMGATPSPG